MFLIVFQAYGKLKEGMEALEDCVNPRVEEYEKVLKAAEVARCSVAIFTLLDKDVPMEKKLLQASLIKEIKELRKFADEKKDLPQPLLIRANEILWGRG